MIRTRFAAGLAASILAAAPVAAQEGLSAQCAGAPQAGQPTCYAVAQAAASLQPQIGIALAGGNPTLGTASTGGVHLGVLPRVSATLRVNAAFARIPDVLTPRDGSGAALGTRSLTIPTVNATASVGVFSGVSVAPTVGGVGALDLLVSASVVPLGLSKGFENSATVTVGVGGRVGLLRESFTLPGVSASVMYRRLPSVDLGDVCPGGTTGAGSLEVCPGGGHAGEAHFDFGDLSTRLAVSKRLLAIGFAAGVGYDRFSGDLTYAYRSDDPVTGVASVRRGAGTLKSGRTSAFANASLNLLVASATVEAGWMRGGDPISGYTSAASDYDPKKGTPFASLGVRIGL
jgi:hypothetical protein